MALSVVPAVTRGRAQERLGTRAVSFGRVNLGASYVTAGMPFVPKSALGHVGDVDRVVLSPRYAAGATGPVGKQFFYDHTNQKIVAVVTSTGAEVANATDLSLCILDVEVVSA